MGSNRPKTERFSVDAMMRKLASTLVRDFQVNLDDTNFCHDFQVEVNHGDIIRARELSPAVDSEMNTATFKAAYQIQSIFKRYRFCEDTYSEQQLIDKAINSYQETQSRLADLNLDALPANCNVVLDLAARYIARVLGVYSDKEHRDLSRFGSGASVGVPAKLACEGQRWELPLTGSLEQISWFDSEMSQIESVQEYWRLQKSSDSSKDESTYQETSSLALSLVPKTFKSLRSIMPNTTIGSYMSDGLGRMMRKRLKREGYDISTLQMRHRYLAHRSSITGLSVTADLSSASDSISVALVNRLFPKDWLEILHKSRIGTVRLPDGTCEESLTFCTMGIGYTFPLQTLVFLALLKAVERVHYGRLDRRTISVYGDDLIYSSRMHKQVVYYFEQFGFIINLEKTFDDGQFRESCGGDYYRGVDVRPFQPRNGAAFVSKQTYEAMLYKFANGLLARWSEHEIGMTLRYLTSEIVALVNKVKLVPCNYPDDSGLKCPTLKFWKFLEFSQCAQPKHVGHGVYRFSFLRLVSDERKEMRHEPYFWLAMRGVLDQAIYASDQVHQELPSPVATFVNKVVGVKDAVSSLITREDRPIKTFRSLTGRRLRRTSTFVTVSHSGRYRRQSGTSCFEDRRQIVLYGL